MEKAATIYDVANLAGVSIATVSFSFQKPEKVAPTTRQTVLAAAQKLSYVPSGHARSLAGGRTGVLGLCSYDYLQMSGAENNTENWDDLRNYPLFIDEVQRGVQLESWRAGYSILVRGGVREDDETAVTDLASRVDGLAVFSNSISTDLLIKLARRIPVVTLSGAPKALSKLSHVSVDNHAAMEQLTEHLLQVHQLRKLMFVGSGTVDIDQRFAGFREALRKAGVRAPRSPLGGLGSTPHAHQIRPVVSDLIERDDLPQALVCATDQHAAVALELLEEAGIAVPGRVAVTGFDGLLMSRYTKPTLTTIRQPMTDMGAAAVRLLIESMSQPRGTAVTQTLDATLILGRSCGCQ